jgi:hypothetical protein
MPVFRIPMHLSYVLYLAQNFACWPRPTFAALFMCRLRDQPSLLLHPLDFSAVTTSPN